MNKKIKILITVSIIIQCVLNYINFEYFRLEPDYADGFYNKGDILASLGRIEEAIEFMTIAI